MSLVIRSLSVLLATAVALFTTVTPGFAVHGGDREVTGGSDDAVFSQNKQNEPAIAVDANHSNVLAAGANDNIDMEACNVGDDKTCPFTPGVGVTGIQFSFDSGHTWIQPTYTGFSARDCLGVAGDPSDTCTPKTPAQGGLIGTLPWYFEEGLVSFGDPAVAFGPQPGPGGFSWANGSRLYVANLAFDFPGTDTFKGFSAIGVSRIDGIAATGLTSVIVANKNNWSPPVLASLPQSSAVFADKEQVWADNAASSPFFGNVYICYAEFRGAGAAPLMVARSTDGGDTWEQKQVTRAANVSPKNFGQSGCTIRTDNIGIVYAFYEAFHFEKFLVPPRGAHAMVKSLDGGETWTKPVEFLQITDPCYRIDPVIGRCVMDGVAGARNDLAAAPSVDIANGAPTGAGATNLIVDAWADGRDGLDNEDVMVSYSMDGGQTWSEPMRISSSPDRGYYAAPAVSPDGEDVYVVYNAFTTPFRDNTTDLRSLVGVVKHASVIGGTPGEFTEIHRGVPGDPRGSAQNNLVAEFLGDYVYAVATRTYAAAVWNDARNAADCSAIDTWRMSLRTSDTSDDVPRPAPQQACIPVGTDVFGNSDIFGGSWADPTP